MQFLKGLFSKKKFPFSQSPIKATPCQNPSPFLNSPKKLPLQASSQNIQSPIKQSKLQSTSISSIHKPTQSLSSSKRITIEQLKIHNKAGDLWVCLDGIVYNLTDYLKYHPGGKVLIRAAGKESIDMFNQYHSWVNYKHVLRKYQIGYLDF